MRKRYLGVYSHGKFNFMDEKEALCAEYRAYCDVCVKNNVLMVDMTPFVIQRTKSEESQTSFVKDLSLTLKMTNSLSVGQATPDAFTGLPRKSDDFLAMTDNRNMIEREVA